MGFLGMYARFTALWIVLLYTAIQKGPLAPDHESAHQSLTVGNEGRDLTIELAAAGPHTLHVGLVWWTLGILDLH